MKLSLCISIFVLSLLSLRAEWQAGVSGIKITPEKPVPLVGYAARTNVFKTVDHDVYAYALALQDDTGSRALLITTDICTLSPKIAEPICAELIKKTGLKREQIILSLSHTHSGPLVTETPSRNVPPEATNAIVEYAAVFHKKLVQAGTEALSKLATAKISFGLGSANFAMNRREFTTNGVILGVSPRGYVDRSVPILRIDSPDGELRAVLFGYACHGTTLPSDALIVSPDYPGYARDEVQKKYPKAEALFIAGLGGSSNPYPRTGLVLAKEHGAELGKEICRVLETKLRPIKGSLSCARQVAELPLETQTKEQLRETARTNRWVRGVAEEMIQALERGETLPKTHKAPVAVWQFGSDLTLVGLSGEVVGEYVPLIERSIGHLNLWLSAYCNAVSGYIPTQETLREGGYECRGLYEGLGWYSPEAEKVLVEAVTSAAKKAGRHFE